MDANTSNLPSSGLTRMQEDAVPPAFPVALRRTRSIRGVTLVELMTVVAIMAILAGVGVPAFQSLIASNRAHTGANDLLYGLSLARAESVRRNTTVRFCLVPGSGQWQVEIPGGAAIGEGALPAGTSVAASALDAMSVPGAACVSYRSDGFAYSANRNPIAAGTITITAGSSSRIVNVRVGALYVG